MPTSVYGSGGLLVVVPLGCTKMVGEADDSRHIPDITCFCITVGWLQIMCLSVALGLLSLKPLCRDIRIGPSLSVNGPCAGCSPQRAALESNWGLVGGPLVNDCLHPNFLAPARSGPECYRGLLIGCDSF